MELDSGRLRIYRVSIRIRLLNKEWLYYFYCHVKLSELKAQQRMAGLSDTSALQRSSLGQYPIPVPPLPEQRRIVGILDEAFEGIATAKANAEKNLQNARAVFESHLNAVFTQRGEGWMEKLVDVGESFQRAHSEMLQSQTISRRHSKCS